MKKFLSNVMLNKLKNLKYVNLIQLLRLHTIRKQLIFGVAFAAFIFLNIALAPLALRIDLSQGQAYTLSKATKNIIQKNDKKIVVTFFASSGLPTKLLPLKTDVTDLLNEYKKQGKNIQVNIVDPNKDKQAAAKAQEFGIPQVQFSQLEQDKYAVTASHFGIAIEQGTQVDTIPQVTDVESLEYNLTSAMYKLTRTNIPKIAILGYPEGPDPQQDPIGAMRGVLQQQFTVDTINLATEGGVTSIDPSYKTLVVFDTSATAFSSFELDAIKTYLDKKGKALFFVDGVSVDESLNTQPTQHNLGAIFKEFGIILEENLVLSMASEVVNFGNDLVNIYTPYPFWLKTIEFNPQATYFSNIAQLTYPWVSSLKLQPKSGYEIRDLVKSAEQSWAQTNNFQLNPQQIPEPQEKDFKQYIVAAESKKKDGGMVVVVPSSRFILNRFYTRGSGNFEFALNVLNDLASEGALTGIRQRAVNIYPLPPDLSETEKDAFKYANILLLPALFAAYGAYRIWKRR